MMAARQFGERAYQASAAAAILIWVVGSAGLLILAAPQTGAGRLNAALLAMLVRMTVPLAVMVVLTRSNHPLMTAGLGGLIVVHYLAGLAIETQLALRIVAQAPGGSASAGVAPS